MAFHAEPSVTISARVAAVLLKNAGGEEFLKRYRGFRADVDRDLESVRIAAAWHVRSVVNDTLAALPATDRQDSAVMSVTTAQAAELLTITPQGVRKAISENRLPAHRFGRLWLIDVTDLDDFRSRSTAHG